MMPELDRQAELSLTRLLPRLSARLLPDCDTALFQEFSTRLEQHFASLFSALVQLYGQRYDFFYHLEEILISAARAWLERPSDLRALDRAREHNPRWFQSQQMMGAVCYVDLFAGDLRAMERRIPYLRQLGITYLHLMPLFLAPKGNNDGGYAVSSYRDVNPALGTIEDLARLAGQLREEGMSLVLDFIFNHTSDEHAWAARALAGDRDYQDYYYMYPDRGMPDAYEKHLRDIFPDQRPGCFTYRQEIDRWVWTTFHSFQWDLNYSNPVVFQRMGEEMLFLANHGAEFLRLDAVAFAWKRLGTPCESLPEVHLLVQAFNALARMAAPALLFKSEAIVHPDEVARYISPLQCQLSYNPLLMALMWEALATREVRLLQYSVQQRFRIDESCAWVNYVRSHDDIGWTFADQDAAHVGIDSYWHRRFLNDFYTGRFAGSFASGLPFQENPRTGDARISGTCASLAGLEAALHSGDAQQIDFALRRIVLLYGVALAIGGIPLLYLGDELGMLNDYRYDQDPARADDSRWVHRPRFREDAAERRQQTGTVEHTLFGALRKMIEIRKSQPAMAGGEMEVVHTGNGGVFSFVRRHDGGTLLVLANFTEREQRVPSNEIRVYGQGYRFSELIGGADLLLDQQSTVLSPYALQWLIPIR